MSRVRKFSDVSSSGDIARSHTGQCWVSMVCVCEDVIISVRERLSYREVSGKVSQFEEDPSHHVTVFGGRLLLYRPLDCKYTCISCVIAHM